MHQERGRVKAAILTQDTRMHLYLNYSTEWWNNYILHNYSTEWWTLVEISETLSFQTVYDMTISLNLMMPYELTQYVGGKG